MKCPESPSILESILPRNPLPGEKKVRKRCLPVCDLQTTQTVDLFQHGEAESGVPHPRPLVCEEERLCILLFLAGRAFVFFLDSELR